MWRWDRTTKKKRTHKVRWRIIRQQIINSQVSAPTRCTGVLYLSLSETNTIKWKQKSIHSKCLCINSIARWSRLYGSLMSVHGHTQSTIVSQLYANAEQHFSHVFSRSSMSVCNALCMSWAVYTLKYVVFSYFIFFVVIFFFNIVLFYSIRSFLLRFVVLLAVSHSFHNSARALFSHVHLYGRFSLLPQKDSSARLHHKGTQILIKLEKIKKILLDSSFMCNNMCRGALILFCVCVSLFSLQILFSFYILRFVSLELLFFFVAAQSYVLTLRFSVYFSSFQTASNQTVFSFDLSTDI